LTPSPLIHGLPSIDIVTGEAGEEVSWERWTIHAQFPAGGEPGGFVLYGQDITDQKRAESQAAICKEGLDEVIRTRTEALRLINMTCTRKSGRGKTCGR